MGSSGHAFIAHTKALSPPAQVKDAGYGLPPHPLRLRAGQRYSSRVARARGLVIVERVDGDTVLAAVVHQRRRKERLKASRLAELREDGQGRHYQFQGYAPRRYETYAFVWAIDAEHALLCVPEWHPRRPVRFPARLLPPAVRAPGAWLGLRCDLSASSAARLQPAELRVDADPGEAVVHRPALALATARVAK